MRSVSSLLLLAAFCLCLRPAAAVADEVVLSGRVLDTAGRPVAGAEVGLYRGPNVRKPADFLSNRTRRDGAYRVAAPAGTYWAVAVLRRGGRKFGPLKSGDKHSGEPVEIDLSASLRLDFEIMDLREAARKGGKAAADVFRVRGRVVDSGGKPVAMAYVLANSAAVYREMPKYVSAWTGADGVFELFMPKGRYYLGAAADFPPPQRRLDLELTVDGAVSGVRVPLRR